MRASFKLVVISLCLLLLSGAAFASNCDFTTFTCAQGAHAGAFIGGSGTAIGGGGAGLLLNSNMFTVSTHNGDGGADVVIIAANTSGFAGATLDGIAFKSLPEGLPNSYTGAISQNLTSSGFCGSCTLQFGYVDLKTALPANGSITVTASGLANGTAVYALVLNSQGQIIITTSNSSSGVTDGGTSVPEPGSLSLLVTGLLGIGGQAWRKLRG
jgi:hypothetical protein